MYSDRQALANIVDPDETPQNVSLGSTLFATHLIILDTTPVVNCIVIESKF